MNVLVLLCLQGAAPPIDVDAFVEFASIPAPVGREERLREAIRARLPEWAEAREDEAGGLRLEIGAEATAVEAISTPLGDPALEVASVSPEGYLRVAPVGRRGASLPLAWIEGRPVTILGTGGAVEGAAVVNSVHLRGSRPDSIGTERIWIDVGAASGEEVRARGIGPGARIAPTGVPARLAGDSCAGWFVGRRACAFALTEALRGLDPDGLRRPIAVLWTTEKGEPASTPSGWIWKARLDAAESSDPIVRAPFVDDAPGLLTLRTSRLGTPTETVDIADVELLARAVREFLETGRW